MVLPLLLMAATGGVMGSVGADSRPLTGYVDHDRLVFKTSLGVRCTADLDKMDSRGGLGSVRCSDGRRGSFGWTFLGRNRATGDGWLSGESLTITFEVENHTQF